jgi:hypothetical protein
MGRILRIPECSDEEGRTVEVDFNRRLRGAQRQITPADKQESSRLLTNALRTGTSVDGIGLSPRHTTVKAVRYEMVKSLQRILGPVMIRRTVQSTRWDDSKINPNLPDKSVSNFCVRLTEHEHGLLNGELGIVGESLDGQVFDFEVSSSVSLLQSHIDLHASVSGCSTGSAFVCLSRTSLPSPAKTLIGQSTRRKKISKRPGPS